MFHFVFTPGLRLKEELSSGVMLAIEVMVKRIWKNHVMSLKASTQKLNSISLHILLVKASPEAISKFMGMGKYNLIQLE